ncbi:MAG: hypothetical protein ACYC75_02055 [Minisyncoccota bacterium]
MAKKTTKGKIAAGMAVGLAAVGALAATGYYFYGSKHAKAHRKITAKWATDMKREVIRETKRLKKVSPREFEKIVDRVASTYRGFRSVNAADLKRATNELKSNWDMVQREAQKTARANISHAKVVGQRAFAASKKTMKKVVKKVVAKKRKTVRKDSK